ncbi:T9SS type A sorting domain-containing protein, partial [candidate division KSB1 bacterium]|nr:T9SS type A sorting domain-containing protein [candidate division KSB1 bacterium]
GQEFKFGIGGGDNEGGYGNNHIANIDDQRQQSTINAQFGSIDPIFYYAWDFDNRGPATSVSSQSPQRPLMFALEQNYPNPFNPVTHIRYSLARSVDVTLTIYNAMGQEVVKLVQEKQPAGYYQVTWDGRDEKGQQVSSGLYFYQIKAGRYIESQKMMLLR